MLKRWAVLVAIATLAATVLVPATGHAASASEPGKDSKAVGFIFVGPKDDFGYNQAAYQGAMAVKKANPKLKILTAENVPEDDTAARVMEGMIDRGAKILFATSYGHLDAALKVAKAHPDVAVVQQGNFIEGTIPPNAGTFFGTVYEPVYLAGVAAGLVTKSNKLGYVYAFPIPQTIDNIDAFELGALSVNKKAKTYTINTSSWCDPQKQADAARTLLAKGVDVVTQHQDCTSTVIKKTEAAGKMTVGYHADASKLAKKGWITGSEWSWGKLYTDIVKTAEAGKFTGSKYNANYRVGYKTGENPFVQSKYGKKLSTKDKKIIAKAKKRIMTTGSPFQGPVVAQNGKVIVKKGVVPDYATIEKIDVFVKGVVGQIPKG
jgi:simple sugar transport system substrate-binding protein/basic membrane protein A